jgi:hypothetical protein
VRPFWRLQVLGEPKVATQLVPFGRSSDEPFRAGFDDETVTPDCPELASEARVLLEDAHHRAGARPFEGRAEAEGGGQSRQPSADDDDVASRMVCTIHRLSCKKGLLGFLAGRIARVKPG